MTFPTTPLLDNLNRANGPIGSDWGQIESLTPLLVISSNKAVEPTPCDGAGAYWVHAISDDIELYLTFYFSEGSDLYIYFRLDTPPYPSGAIGYMLHIYPDTGGYRFVLSTNGGGPGTLGNVLVTDFVSGSLAGISAIGSALKVYHKPPAGAWTAALISVADTTFGTGRSYVAVATFCGQIDDFSGGTPVVTPREGGDGYGGGEPGGDPGGGGGGGVPGPGGPGTGEPPSGGTPPDPGTDPGTDPPGGGLHVGGPTWVTHARQIAAFGVGSIGLRVTDVAYIQEVRVRGDYGVQVDADSSARVVSGLEYATSNILGELNPLHGERGVWDDIGYPGRHARDLWEGAPVYHVPPDAAVGQAPIWDGDKWVAGDVSTPGDLHVPVTLGTDAGAVLGLTGQQIDLDPQDAHKVLAGPASGSADDPTFRLLVTDDLPSNVIATVQTSDDTPTTLYSFDANAAADGVYIISGNLIIYEAAENEASWKQVTIMFKVLDGAVTFPTGNIGDFQTIYYDNVLLDVTKDLTDGVISIIVTGTAEHTIVWRFTSGTPLFGIVG